MSGDIGIASDQLIATVSPLGAELQRLADHDGNDYLWDGDPAVWGGRAPILFPVVGALNEGRYRLGDRRYAMAKHGFARRSLFEPIDRQAHAVTFRLEASPDTREFYPFEFALDVRFEISESTLTVGATIANRGAETMPASLGFHPAFRWPLPSGRPRAEHRLEFAQDEPAPIRRVDADGLLQPQHEPSPVNGRTLLPRDDLFVNDALIFDRLASRSVRYGASTGPRIDVGFGGLPLLGVWTKPGANFLCIEPWHGVADPAGFDGEIWDKPGIIAIAPGNARHFAMTISITDSEEPGR